MTKLFYVALISALVNNVLLTSSFGIEAALESSDKISTALRVAVSVIFVTTISSIITCPINEYLLSRFDLDFIQPMCFLLIEFAICFTVKLIFKSKTKKSSKAFNKIYFLIPLNSAVLGIILINVQTGYSFIRSAVNSFCGALGFAIILIILAGLREKIRFNDVPRPFEGTPILLITASLMAIAFYGFSSLL